MTLKARKDVRESDDRARGKSTGGGAGVATVFGVVGSNATKI